MNAIDATRFYVIISGMDRLLTWWRQRRLARRQAASERDLARDLSAVESHNRLLEKELASVKEELERQRVSSRIQQAEIELLTSVCERNLSRVRAELAVKAEHEP